jgi:hypothetical protein
VLLLLLLQVPREGPNDELFKFPYRTPGFAELPCAKKKKKKNKQTNKQTNKKKQNQAGKPTDRQMNKR